MLKYFIAEDEDIDLHFLSEKIKALPMKMKFMERKRTLGETEKFLAQNINDIDILFLDVKIIGGDAFGIIDWLRKNTQRKPYIIILTKHLEGDIMQSMINQYHDYPYSFIHKDFNSTIFDDTLKAEVEKANRYCTNITTGNGDFVIVNGHHQIDTKDIAYIQTRGNRHGGVTIVKRNRDIMHIDIALVEILYQIQKVNTNIIQVHRAYAVNLECVEIMTMSIITLNTGDKVNIGKLFKKSTKSEWDNYIAAVITP